MPSELLYCNSHALEWYSLRLWLNKVKLAPYSSTLITNQLLRYGNITAWFHPRQLHQSRTVLEHGIKMASRLFEEPYTLYQSCGLHSAAHSITRHRQQSLRPNTCSRYNSRRDFGPICYTKPLLGQDQALTPSTFELEPVHDRNRLAGPPSYFSARN